MSEGSIVGADTASTPVADGFSMPARFSTHASTLVTWPPEGERVLEEFRDEVEAVVRAIARFEPVILVVDPADASSARVRLDDVAEIVTIPVDCAWIRDNGPIFVTDAERRVAGVHFDFTGWGGKYPADSVRQMPARVIEHLGMPCYSAGAFICEGGGISVDGEGTLITTEEVMLNPNRYSASSREDVERSLRDWLGIEKVIWLAKGLVEDTGTDGHVDNIVEYLAPGVVLAQTVRDESNPNFGLLADNLQRLRSATDARGRRLEIIEMDVLPYQEAADGKRYVVPYANAYVVNGAVIAPAVDAADDERGFRILEQAFPGREIVPVPSIAQAVGGGGLGCITQQVPEGQPA
ncbi:MAG: agmatine deiminase family protein [Deltaproteobacteria bacterium]|nr:agmatine deiminase family protein [Deltaproteobacteria bacterium]MBW2397777.1 agmatine deiminase family protein [Deltaproteobacteria bacterium]